MYAIGLWMATMFPSFELDGQPPIELVDARDAEVAGNKMEQNTKTLPTSLTIGPANLYSQKKRERAGRVLIKNWRLHGLASSEKPS